MEPSIGSIGSLELNATEEEKDSIPLSKLRHELSLQLSKNSMSPSIRRFLDKLDKEKQIKTTDITSFSDVEPFEKEFLLHCVTVALSENQDTLTLAEKERPLMINGVRIQPGCMVFKDAYDGKRFQQALTITNCGKHSVNIRISPPTSKAFKIKAIPIGHTLSAGLSIVKHIKYIYTKPTAIPQASMDIFIDNDYLRYQLLVFTCYTQVKVSPKLIDFGEIDLGMVSDQQKITVTNTGTKQAHYATDLGRNQLEIIVEPTKGTVQPGEAKEMTVEVFGESEGEFNQEFWIKTDPLQRVHIQGHFIQPCLRVDYPFNDKNFLIITFPKTFVGVSQQKNVIIENFSSTPAVFCVNGRTKDEKLPYKAAAKKDANFKQFQIVPLEGRLQRDQKYIMRVIYTPDKLHRHTTYYICHIVVDVMKCRTDRNPFSQQKCNNIEAQQSISQVVPTLNSISVLTTEEDPYDQPQKIPVLDDMISILLYGEVELPEVTLQPDKLYLRNLKIYETHVETVNVLNKSTSLPLVLRYNKAPSIELQPGNIQLPPNQTVQVSLKIRPTKMGNELIKVALDVLYQQKETLIKLMTVTMEIDYSAEYTELRKFSRKTKPSFLPGITPKNCNEVGYLVDDVRFNTKIEKPVAAIVDKKRLVFDKGNDALIAFPNDRPGALKPWRNPTPCKTIFAQLPRLITDVDVDYDLTSNEQRLKDATQSYYLKYIRSLNKKNHPDAPDEEFEDYMTTNPKRILLECIRRGELSPSILHAANVSPSLFVPLTPYEIHNTVVSPQFIQLGRLAANTECSDHFSVENKNNFPIHISIKALYPSIKIVQEAFILGPNSQKDIDFTYHSDNSGTHHIPMFIVMNFFHILEVTVLAKIVANTVKCVTKDITIVPTEKTAFLELQNPINSDVAFEVDTNFFHLESFPSKGVIPAKKNITLTITFNPEVGYTPLKEIAVISESGAKELVEVRFDHKKASVSVSAETLTFKDLPLNTPVSQQLYIVNNSDQLTPLNIELEGVEEIPELEITPMKALILQKGDIIINFTLKYNQIINFNILVNLIFQYEYKRQITVKGNVVYPSVSFKPDLIKIPKIPSGSTVKTPFRVINNNDVNNYLLFRMQDYPEFSILNKLGEDLTEGMLTLAPKERLELLLEFHPQEPVAYCIYLPYILNGVLGPPELNCPDTLQFGYYLNSTGYEVARGGMEKLKVLKILCAARKKFLKFSTLHLEFGTFETTRHEFAVTNVDNAPHEVSLKIPKNKSFHISPPSNDTTADEDTINTWLNPEDSYTVSIEFVPTTYGIVTIDIPIYVTEYSATQPFNYLKLTGTNHDPQIASSETSIYFTPIYAGSRQTKNIAVTLTAHRCNKSLEVSYGHGEVEVSLVGQEAVSELKTVVKYLVAFAPKEDCEIEAAVKFSCPCRSSTTVDVFACSHKSLVINFMSDPSIVHQSSYPLFPATDDQSNYAVLLRTVAGIIERWLYTQGFFYRSFYRIPDDIACYPIEIAEKDKNKNYRKKAQAQLPLVQLLINLMDKSILKYIDCGVPPSQELTKRTLYNFVTYRNTVSFLKSQGIRVPGLKPEYLLIFQEYTEYKKNIADKKLRTDKDDFSEDTFYRFSKQMWLDLFFHIYKNLVLKRIVNPTTPPPIEDENEFIRTDKENFDRYLKLNSPRFPTWYHCDAKLLLWLEYHYNRQKTILWPNEKFEAVHHLKDFSDVDDSISLATVTVAYCPYLQNLLKDIYPVPKNLEQKVHNACRVVKSWKSLKLSFDVHPHTIVSANKIKIIFIVTYLYEVLPHFYPTNQVRIEAPLSESATYNLCVQNCGHVPIQYIAVFFGENSSLFKLDCSSITIPGGKTKTLNLTYFAKRVLDASVILVLTGEAAGGQRYAKSMAVSITGAPVTTSSDEIKLQVETYKSSKKKIQLKTPYGKKYKAKIFICFKEPESYKDLHAISHLKEDCIPREIDVVKSECEFTGKGEATVTLSTCFLTQGQMRLYLYFCNADIGDFCVLIKIFSIWNKAKAEVINVDLPRDFGMECTCRRGFNRSCPQAFTVNVPCKNKLMLKSTETLIMKCFTKGCRELIKRFFGTPILIRILKFYLERFPQGCMLPSSIFDDEAKFVVSPSKNFSSPQQSIKIGDVTADQTVPLTLHWDQSSGPTQAYLELKNTNEKEIRLYQLIFPTVNVSIGTDDSRHSVNSAGNNKAINKS